MTKQELEAKIKELSEQQKEYQQQLYYYDYNELKAKYGSNFNCDHCMYSSVMTINDHNVCGADNCTCCNNNCERYKPDNLFSKYIKNNCRGVFSTSPGYISEEVYDAIRTLAGDIFAPEDKMDGDTFDAIFCILKVLKQKRK